MISVCRRRNAAFTLIEIMVALALSLIILAAVITMFGKVTEGVSESRSLLEMAERLRLTAERLQLDLAGVTVTMNPPRNPANNEGYFEYIEGSTSISSLAQNTNVTPNVSDNTVGQVGDILMFTTRSSGQPFVGKDPLAPGGVGRFYVAEVAWFIRGHTLHRRVLLVLPDTTDLSAAPRAGFYATYDVSARWNGTKMVPNTLADLTQRENRFAHNTTYPPVGPSPCDWGQLGLPTLAECSANWTVGTPPAPPAAKATIDFWSNRTSRSNGDTDPWADNALLTGGSRLTDDIILTNVIGFDVKAWDPKANSGHGAYVDLGYNTGLTGTSVTNFSSLGDKKSSLMPQDPNASSKARVYDTYSTSYFDPKGSNGIDDDVNGVVDDDGEKSPTGTTLLPPYWYPLRGIQVKIRVFEPDSKQIREVTVVQDFLPQ